MLIIIPVLSHDTDERRNRQSARQRAVAGHRSDEHEEFIRHLSETIILMGAPWDFLAIPPIFVSNLCINVECLQP
jgi:hypothetical protein